MRRLIAIALLGILALLAAAGCGAQGEIDPVPTPLGRPDDGLVLLSASTSMRGAARSTSDGLVAIFGLAGAVEPGLRVVVENDGGSFAVEARVNDDGSFATVLPAAASDRLRIYPRLRDGETVVDGPALEREVPVVQDGVNPAPPKEYVGAGPGIGARAITAVLQPDGKALVTAAIDTAAPGLEVVIGNVNVSAHVGAIANEEGAFEARIPARRGDMLVIFGRWADAAADDPTSASEAITVPVN
jgi:hypothetical protein